MGTLQVGGTTLGVKNTSTNKVDLSNTNLGSDTIFPGPTSGSFGGHILQSNSGVYNFTNDTSVSTTSATFGPVVSMEMIQANAKVIGLLTLGEIYSGTASGQCTMSLAYKTSSFSAGQGNTGQGVTVLTGNQCVWRVSGQNPACFILNGTLSNTAGQTIYFAGEAVSSHTRYLNYSGGSANCTLTVFEVKT